MLKIVLCMLAVLLGWKTAEYFGFLFAMFEFCGFDNRSLESGYTYKDMMKKNYGG